MKSDLISCLKSTFVSFSCHLLSSPPLFLWAQEGKSHGHGLLGSNVFAFANFNFTHVHWTACSHSATKANFLMEQINSAAAAITVVREHENIMFNIVVESPKGAFQTDPYSDRQCLQGGAETAEVFMWHTWWYVFFGPLDRESQSDGQTVSGGAQ